jgi:hypothetical protein
LSYFHGALPPWAEPPIRDYPNNRASCPHDV